MQKRKKTAIIVLSCAATVLCAMLFLSKLVLIIKFDDKRLKDLLREYFKNKISKAIKYEEASVSLLGNVVIKNFYISNSSDFNDNINLVHSKKAVIRLRLLPLLRGSLDLSGVDFYDNSITVVKKYEEGYAGSFGGIFRRDLTAGAPSGGGAVQIRLYNSHMLFKEFMLDAPVLVELSDLYVNVVSDGGDLSYIVKGFVDPAPGSGGKKGSVDLRGNVRFGKKRAIQSRLRCKGIDLSILNPYVKERLGLKYDIKGAFWTDMRLVRNGDVLTVFGDGGTERFYARDPVDDYHVISNEKMTCAFDITRDSKRGLWKCKKLSLKDSDINIDVSGEYRRNEKEHALSARILTNEIDLADLSARFSPMKGCAYRGKLSVKGGVDLDIRKNRFGSSVFVFHLAGLEVTHVRSARKLLSSGYLWARIQGPRLALSLHSRADRSDCTVRAACTFGALEPLQSKSEIVAHSESVQWHYLFGFFSRVAERLYIAGMDDRKRGFEEVLFLERPASRYVIGNDVVFSWKSGALVFGDNARLGRLALDFSLKGGTAALSGFSLEGYEGTYSLAMNAVFNTDRPFMSMRGSAANMDAGAFFRDYGVKSISGGRCSVEFDYALCAFRLGHFVDNAQGNFSLTLSDGALEGHPLQAGFDSFLKKNGVDAPSISPMKYSTMTFCINQSGENFLFRGLQVVSDRLAFSAWGPYTYADGIKMPVTVSVRDGARNAGLQVLVSGPLSSPCLTVPSAQKPEGWCPFRKGTGLPPSP